jgi:hypothetical protein
MEPENRVFVALTLMLIIGFILGKLSVVIE